MSGFEAQPTRRLIGREDELQAIHALFASLAEGPAALVISGQAGIGKTALWRAGIVEARERGLALLTSTPAEADTKLSFVALGDLLGAVLPRTLPELPTPQRRALGVALQAEVGPPPDQRAVAVACLGVLRILARDGPLVVAVDDVQWLDPASAAVLEFAARRLRDEPIGLLLAMRSESCTPDPFDLARLWPEERLRHLVVGPLSLGALHHILLERLDAVVTRPTMRRVHELSAGNPFFALETARALASGRLRIEPGEPLRVPPGLRDLVRARLAELPTKTQEALRVAAALSRPTVDLVAEATAPRALSLGPAIDAQVIELDRDRIRFTHPLLASGAYAMIEPGIRRKLHRRLGEVVRDPEERARHLALAATAPDANVAAELDTAAARARARGAVAAAAELAEKAVALTPADDAEACGRRTLAAAWFRFEAGDTDAARQVLEEAASVLPAGSRRASMLAALARIYLLAGDQVLATDLFSQASSEAGGDVGVRIEAEAGLVMSLFHRRKNLRLAARRAREVVRLAEEIGDGRVSSLALSMQGLVECLLGRPAAGQAIERALTCNTVDQAQVMQEPLNDYAVYLLWTDRVAEASWRLRAQSVRATERGDESSLPNILCYLGLAEYLSGNWDEADDVAEQGLEVALQTGQKPWQALALALRALLEASRGCAESARRCAAEALEGGALGGGAVARITALSALGLLELSLGNPGETHRALGPLVDEAEAEEIAEPGSIRFVADDIEALILLGRSRDAERVLVRLEAQARTLGRASALAASARCRGLLAAAEGDVQSALDAFDSALAEHGRVPMPLERARSMLALGTAQRRAKQKRAARESLEEALAVFEQLGAALFANRARSELGRISGRVPSGSALTPGEQHIAELVAEGKSNKEVARALFVTEKTVEANLSKIYDKLNVRSRTELARRITSQEVGAL